MPTYRKIRRAEWEANAGQATKAHAKGTCTIFYSNGRRQEFANVDRGEFFEWERKHWDYNRPPNGVQCLQPEIVPEQADIDAEIAEQEETEYQAKQDRRRRMFALADSALRAKLSETEYNRQYASRQTAKG